MPKHNRKVEPAHPDSLEHPTTTVTAEDQRYLYTPLTNEIFAIPDEFPITDHSVGRLLDERSSVYSKNDTDASKKEGSGSGQRAQAEGFAIGFNGYYGSDYDSYVDERLSSLIIGVSHDCNLRCSYCVYDPSSDERRNHEENTISIATIEDAIETVRGQLQKGEPLSIMFYGGEPLTNFEAIRHAVAYANGAIQNPTEFFLISNGLLLTPERFEFFVDHNFDISVSLDGPPEIQNTQRRTQGDAPSFSQIFDNLRQLKETAPTFYNHNVSFQATLTPPYQFITIDDFFSNNEVVADNPLSVNWVVDDGVIPDDEKFESAAFEKLKDRYVEALLQDEPESCKVGNALFGSTLGTFEQRKMSLTSGDLHPHAMCVPGADKLFVDTDAATYMCQRVDDYQIGTVDDGIDADRAWEALDTYVEKMTPICANCWLHRFCQACYPKFFYQNELDPQKQRLGCTHQQKLYHHALEVYLRVKRRGATQETILQAGPAFTPGDRDPNAF